MPIDLKLVKDVLGNAREIIAKKIREKVKTPCQRILLINAQQVSEEDFILSEALRGRCWNYPPYSCGVLNTHLINRGYNTSIIDLNLDMLVRARQANFNYGDWKIVLNNRLEKFRPDLVGISCMFSMSHDIMNDINREIKLYGPDLPIICGGVHLTDSKKLALENCPEADFIGIYECDKTFPDFLDFVNGKISAECLSQIATIINGEYIALEDRTPPNVQEIDVIPFYDDLPIATYSDYGQVGTYRFLSNYTRKASSVYTNRGCRAHCSFCTVPSLFGKGIVKLRSNESVIKEIKGLYDIGIGHLDWLDDDFLYNKKRVVSLLRDIAEMKLNLTWSATNGLIAAAIDEEILDAMVASGCIGFNLGIETGNPQRLRDVHKPGTVERFKMFKKIADKYPHLFIKGFLIIGFPNETVSELLDTVNLGLELQLDWYSIQILNPIPSTEIYDNMVDRGLIQDTLNTNKASYLFGPNGRQRIKEEREKINATEFFNLFGTNKPEDPLKPEDLADYLILMDYKINYEIIFGITNPVKLRNKDMVLRDICERIWPSGPFGQLFYGITRQKLGDQEEASLRAIKTREILEKSAYWQKRFEALDLYTLIDSIS